MDDDRAAPSGASMRLHAETHRVIKGRRWRVSDPAVDEKMRQQLVNSLMNARRAVKAALAADDAVALAAARSRVSDAKVALGERGPKWWEQMSEADISLRMESCLRALQTVDDAAIDVDDLRRRLLL